MNHQVLQKVCQDFGVVSVVPGKPGRQSDIYFLSAPNYECKLVLKVFKKQYKHNSEDGTTREYNSLKQFYLALLKSSDQHVGCPKPIKLYPELNAYVMEFVDGVCLEKFILNRFDKNEFTLIAKNIIRGLEVFKKSVGDLYGDFQPQNIIITKDLEVMFLDPTIPNPKYLTISNQMDSIPADIGYWIYTVAMKTLKAMVLHSKAQIRLIIFSRILVQTAKTQISNTSCCKNVHIAAGFHADRLKADALFKYFLLCLPFKATLKFILAK